MSRTERLAGSAWSHKERAGFASTCWSDLRPERDDPGVMNYDEGGVHFYPDCAR